MIYRTYYVLTICTNLVAPLRESKDVLDAQRLCCLAWVGAWYAIINLWDLYVVLGYFNAFTRPIDTTVQLIHDN